MTKGGSVPGSPDSGDRPGGGQGAPDSSVPSDGHGGRPVGAGTGYTYLSYMLGGMLLYGFIGWLIGRWTHEAYLFPVGMLSGLALSIVLIIYRVTRSGHRT